MSTLPTFPELSTTNQPNIDELGWYQLHPIALRLAKSWPANTLNDLLEKAFPLIEGQAYEGSLLNHYKGRLKHEGLDSLIDQMCNYDMRRLIRAIDPSF